MHPRLAPFRKRVDDRYTDAVEPAGDLVSILIELTPGVETRHDDLEGADILARMVIYGNTAPVVGHGDRIVLADDDRYRRTVTGERLVDAVIDDLVYEMVKPVRARTPDVHTRSLTYRLQTRQDLDVFC